MSRIRTGAPDDNLFGGPYRALPANRITEAQHLARCGVQTAEIARRLGVSLRTAYRYVETGPIQEVEVCGWRAHFAMRPNGPYRLDEWQPILSR